MMDRALPESPPWPQRAWILAFVGAVAGAAIQQLLGHVGDGMEAIIRSALATFIGISALVFGHGWTHGTHRRALIMGVVAGAIVALVFFWNGTPDRNWSAGEGWRMVAALLAVFILVPFWQTASEHDARVPARWSSTARREWIARHLPYAAVHDHAWTNVLTAGLSLLFAGLFFLMLLLMGELFNLVHVRLLSEWLKQEFMIAAIWGAAIGASTGLLRDRRRIIASLQSVAMAVLRIAAPVLAVALVVFLALLPFTGLAPLWDATRSTTPVLLSAAIVALLLANSVLGDGPEDEARAPVLRIAALALAAVMTPLAIIAAVSTGLRIGQYGWTPERLWAAVFVGMACVVALTYLVAVVRGRRAWTTHLRQANLGLGAVILCVALLLSTPLVRFDAIAARDQVARLEDGRTKPDAFDYHALWFDFGPAGRSAIRELALKGGSKQIRDEAAAIQHQPQYDGLIKKADQAWLQGVGLDRRMTVLPQKVHVPELLREQLIEDAHCGTERRCTVYYKAGNDWAIVIREDSSPSASLIQGGSGVVGSHTALLTGFDKLSLAAVRQGRVEVRTETIRRIYLNGKPFGEPLRSEAVTPP